MFRQRALTYSAKHFSRVLIANRGEIACRVIRTCRRLGIESVAVYSEADRHANHVKLADLSVCVGPAPSAESYLVVQNILDAVKSTGAEAVHPGYGFLSENAGFAMALDKAGVAFVGPPVNAIEAMGDKIASKKIAAEAKVSVIPGYVGLILDEAHLLKVSAEIGYPVMIKASAGGGGKGMRVAFNPEDAIEGFALSKAEAMASFNDDRMLVEKFVNQPRHIEIQVIGDKHGNIIGLPERECSIQRRNQKVIEEAPSSFIDPETREKMQKEAVALARGVNYHSAGTVEMLVDDQKSHYFLEMNTRLQVEHPITELITGIDLVEEMLRVASGMTLSPSLLERHHRKETMISGWAMEARVYAEDPRRNFLPSIGKLTKYREPLSLPYVRCDSGVQEGSEISVYYDPMISKLCTHGKDRAECIQNMRNALDNYIIRGINHNIPLLRDILESDNYNAGNITTKFIEHEYPEGFSNPKFISIDTPSIVSALALIEFHYNFIEYQYVVHFNNEKYTVEIPTDRNANYVVIDGKEFEINTTWKMGDEVYVDESRKFAMQLVKRSGFNYQIGYMGNTWTDVKVFTRLQDSLFRHMPIPEKEDFSKFLITPMPGVVVSLTKKAGDKVAVGEELCVIEAMKMQSPLKSEVDGVIKKINFKKGDTLQDGDAIMEFV